MPAVDKLPVRRDGPPKGVPTFRPPQKHEEAKERWRFYGSKLWKQTRAYKLRTHPLCEVCEEAGRTEPATQVHHRIDRLERPDLAYDQSNLQSICASCHSQITRRRSNEKRI